MKNLANCTPTEFLKQTNRLRKALEKWSKDIKLAEIRGRIPQMEIAPKDATLEERKEIADRNKQAVKEQSFQNLSDILEGALEKHPEETLEILALFCFVEPKDVDNHSMSEYFTAISELMNDEATVGFFTSFLSLAQRSGLTA